MPLVAIVGRPNVGKSSLFNKLVGKPVSIVDPTAGVTRDRILHEVRRDGVRFDLMDTGGIGIVDQDKLEADVERQIDRAIDTADRILFVVDGRAGLHALDQHIAERMRKHSERVQLVVNKIDHEKHEPEIYQFESLGCGRPLPVSAEQIRGLQDLLEALTEAMPEIVDEADDEEGPRPDRPLSICFAGRRNVGKSSLTNALVGEERVIVADHAGTTRDAIEVPLHHEEYGDFTLIDTAGLRRKKQLKQDLEFYAAVRSEYGIAHADVVLLVFDASEEVGQVDKKLAHYCLSAHKPVIVVVNKWDLAKGSGTEQQEFTRWLHQELPQLRFAPVIYTSAVDQRNVESLLPLARELHEEFHQRVSTAELNPILEAAVRKRRPRRVGPTATKIFYATQADTTPPTFLIFVNRTDWIESGYSRYLENFFRQHLPFKRVPYHIVFKARESQFHGHADERVTRVAATKADRKQRLLLPKRDGGGKGRGKGGPPRGGRGRR